MRFSFKKKYGTWAPMPSKFAPGLRQNSAGNGHQTLEKKEWRNEPIRAEHGTFSSNQN